MLMQTYIIQKNPRPAVYRTGIFDDGRIMFLVHEVWKR